jgi:hypothetical protein
MFETHLSASGMSNIRKNDTAHNFSFIVGRRHYVCPCVIADFLSPKIARLHFANPTIPEYVVETDDPNHDFHVFMALGKGENVAVAPAAFSFLLALSRELENVDLYCSIFQHEHGHFLSQVTDPDLLAFSSEHSISLISSLLYRLNSQILDAIPLVNLYQILAHPSLRISNEDFLCDYLSSRLSSNQEYLSLLSLVRFEYLSESCLLRFVCSFSLPNSDIDHRLWSCFCTRLISSVRIMHIRQTSPISPDGIIWTLTAECEGNVHDKGVVTITSNSVHPNMPECVARNLANLTTNDQFFSDNGPNEWVHWDFKDIRFVPTHYSMRSSSVAFMRNWVLEGSQDDMMWCEMDRRSECSALCSPYKVGSFPILNAVECRYIRLRQTGKNHNGTFAILLTAFEVFGNLVES